MYRKLLNTVKETATNFSGWKTDRRIVVIESDDWGSIRMPSRKVFDKLKTAGIPVHKSQYDSLDCLEKREDIEHLYEVLSKFRDCKGAHPCITFNTVMGNPDFDKIKESGFERFVFEPFFDSYRKYYNEDLSALWQQGIKQKFIVPQFHAREHLNSELWLRDLQQGFKDTLVAFNEGFFGLKTKTSSPYQQHYLAAYRAESLNDFERIKNITGDGLQLFEKTFGFRSRSFIACNYTWPSELEDTLLQEGVQFLQGQRSQITPLLNGNGAKIKKHFTGDRNKKGQVYLVRNVIFEPYSDSNIDWVEMSLKKISNAFFWHTPAIISTHRINFVSEMSLENRIKNLQLLEKLLKRIIEKWPDVEFVSSDRLGELIKESHLNKN